MALAAITAAFVWGLWFSPPWWSVMGGSSLFLLIISVDVICGPLLTLVIFNPSKSKREKVVDFCTIALIQLAALAYGLHALSYARPVAIVYETDRLRVLSNADLVLTESQQAPAWTKPWGLGAPQLVGVRPVANMDEKFKRIDEALQGVEASQQPIFWQDYALSAPAILERAQPLASLYTKHPQAAQDIETAAAHALEGTPAGANADPSSLRWLPLSSRYANDWVALIDPVTAQPKAYLHLDGFFGG